MHSVTALQAPLKELLDMVAGMEVEDKVLNPNPTRMDPRAVRDAQLNAVRATPPHPSHASTLT